MKTEELPPVCNALHIQLWHILAVRLLQVLSLHPWQIVDKVSHPANVFATAIALTCVWFLSKVDLLQNRSNKHDGSHTNVNVPR